MLRYASIHGAAQALEHTTASIHEAAQALEHTTSPTATEVIVTGIEHPYHTDEPGKYFYFNLNDWTDVFGSFEHGTNVMINQHRGSALIRTHEVRVWDRDNENNYGHHGRFNPISTAASGDWQINDTIRPAVT